MLWTGCMGDWTMGAQEVREQLLEQRLAQLEKIETETETRTETVQQVRQMSNQHGGRRGRLARRVVCHVGPACLPQTLSCLG